VDPNHNIIGHDAFLKMVGEVQAEFPAAVYSRQSNIEIQNNDCRYHWAMHINGQQLMQGFGMTEVNDNGRVVEVVGFFGPLDFGIADA
jgi:hypothetical protein